MGGLPHRDAGRLSCDVGLVVLLAQLYEQLWHPDDHVAASLDQDRRSESSNHLASILPELHERFGHEYVLEIAAS